ncbi:MAG: hypothetical protein MJE77_04290 [Proteobacteria bacterium]|nr:hypothetical protein [Pseudomonadota bacterium]
MYSWVDGGNINNTAGSKNHWRTAKRDLETYNQPGGGAGPHWHATAASYAHEWAHWNIDYIQDSVSSPAGGNWPDINRRLDELRVSKASYATIALATAALQPRVDSLMSTWRSRTIRRWNAIPDTPGVAGSTGYIEGAKQLQPLIEAIETYRKSKGW